MAGQIAGLIVAGGAGARLGGRKPLMPFAGETLLEAVFARVRPQVEALAVNVPARDVALYRDLLVDRIPLLVDPIDPPAGPLGGVLAGLAWLRATATASWLATFPCDTPFLPPDLVAQLRTCASGPVPVAAEDNVRTHALCALWPLECFDTLKRGVEEGRLRSMMSAIESLGGRMCRIACEPEAFFNVNAPEDLAAAEAIRARQNTL